MPSDLLEHMREDVETTARAALEAFSERAKQMGVAVETVMLDLSTGDVGTEVSRLARYFDTTVLQQPDPAGTETADLIEAVLFGSGRPVLIVPSHQGPSQLKRILIAWDEGRPAARAVADALPLLATAEQVEVVTVADSRPRPKPAQQSLGASSGSARHRGSDDKPGDATGGVLPARSWPMPSMWRLI